LRSDFAFVIGTSKTITEKSASDLRQSYLPLSSPDDEDKFLTNQNFIVITFLTSKLTAFLRSSS